MNKEDILLIQELLTDSFTFETKKEEILKLQTKVNLIVEQINAQDKIQEVQNKLMELDKPKEEK